MTNDTTTLNGASQELGELMASNLNTGGVNASANDGLTTLANKILNLETINDSGEINRLYLYPYLKTKGDTSITHDSTNKHYVVTNNSSLGEPGIRWKQGIIPIIGNTIISLDVKIVPQYTYHNFIWVLYCQNMYNSLANSYYYFGSWTNNRILRIVNNGTNNENKINGKMSANVWHTFKLTLNNGTATLDMINKETNSVIMTLSDTMVSDTYVLLGHMELNYDRSVNYFKNFKVEHNVTNSESGSGGAQAAPVK